MGNYGSYMNGDTYVNPFITIDSVKNDSTNIFACDIDDMEVTSKSEVLSKNNQRVKDYTLAKMFKKMVIDYDGSKQLSQDKTSSDYIPSSGNNLPGGVYKDKDGNKIPV